MVNASSNGKGVYDERGGGVKEWIENTDGQLYLYYSTSRILCPLRGSDSVCGPWLLSGLEKRTHQGRLQPVGATDTESSASQSARVTAAPTPIASRAS
jgi:hypothetical protein